MSTELTKIEVIKQQLPIFEKLMGLNARQGTDIQTMALQEIQYVEEHIMNKPEISDCTPDSIILCIKKAIKNNLTLDPDARLMYLIPASVKSTNGQYVKVLTSPRTVNGELSVAYQCGTILDHERPTVAYNEKNQCVSVTVKLLRPSFNTARWETITYDAVYFRKWATASHKKNGRGKQDADLNTLNYMNALYTSHNGGIDPEFAIAKALRHSLEKLGTNPNAKVMDKVSVDPAKFVSTTEEETEVVSEYHEFEDIKVDQL